MPATRRKSRPANLDLTLDDGGSLARRATGFLPDGAYYFEDALDFAGTLTAPVITGAAWLFELYDLDAGSVSFANGPAAVCPATRRFAILYPPFTMAEPTFHQSRGRVTGVAALTPVPAGLAASPLLFDTTFTGRPNSAEHVFEIVAAGGAPQAASPNPAPSLLSLKAKRLIDENYQIYPAIGRIAARLGVSAAHLSRQFKRDYGLTPSAYLRQVRVADAVLRLAQGQPIAAVSAEVGYNDLSRFYKQFRDSTRASPGACQTVPEPA